MIIQLSDDWRITVDGPAWVLQRRRLQKTGEPWLDKHGEPRWDAKTWHGTLEAALVRALSEGVRTPDGVIALDEAVRRVHRAADSLRGAVEAAGLRRARDAGRDVHP